MSDPTNSTYMHSPATMYLSLQKHWPKPQSSNHKNGRETAMNKDKRGSPLAQPVHGHPPTTRTLKLALSGNDLYVYHERRVPGVRDLPETAGHDRTRSPKVIARPENRAPFSEYGALDEGLRSRSLRDCARVR